VYEEEKLLTIDSVVAAASTADVVVSVAVHDPRAVAALSGVARAFAVELAFDSDPALERCSRLQVRLHGSTAVQQHSHTVAR
jgi:hypothetical protein